VRGPDDRTLTPRISRTWLLTFSDVVALILTFFVMLYAMHRVDAARYRSVADSLSRTLNPQVEPLDPHAHAKRSSRGLSPRHAADLAYLATLLAEKAREDKAIAMAHVTLKDDRMVIALPADLLFAPGSATLGEPARDALYALGGLLATIGNAISVEGHTDPEPVSGGPYSSNRALSLARALAVADALHELGYTRDIPAKGLGASRFAALAGVEPRERRFALARRVDVIVGPYRSAP
jgi:chemotaxis protein MotB